MHRRWLRHVLIFLVSGGGAVSLSLCLPLAPLYLAPLFALVWATVLRVGHMARVMHMLAWPVLLWVISWQAPSWLWLLLLLLGVACFRNTARERVPLFLSSHAVATQLAAHLPLGARVVDLGCGVGSVIFPLKACRPDLVVSGVESAWLPYLICRLRNRHAKVILHYGDIWQQNWGVYDVIYCYLSPSPMPRVWQHFCREACPGAQLISNSFAVESVVPHRQLELHDRLHSTLLFWNCPV